LLPELNLDPAKRTMRKCAILSQRCEVLRKSDA
jgi:hypothetical protein